MCDSELGVYDEVVWEQLREWEWLAGHRHRDEVLSADRTGAVVD